MIRAYQFGDEPFWRQVESQRIKNLEGNSTHMQSLDSEKTHKDLRERVKQRERRERERERDRERERVTERESHRERESQRERE